MQAQPGMASMKLVVGLGNPGPRYETTRHNAGFLAIDRLAERWKAKASRVKRNCEIAEAEFDGDKALLLKSQTFMNLSGDAVAPIYRFHKCKPEDLVVIHDDIDLPSLSLKIKTGGGTGGHNGLKSIDAHLGAADLGYHRVRIGVGKEANAVEHVLERFSDDELEALDPLLDQVAEAVELVLRGRVAEAQGKFNRTTRKKDEE